MSKKTRSESALAALCDSGVLDAAAAQRVEALARSSGAHVVMVVHQLGLVDDPTVVELLCRLCEVKPVSEDAIPSSPIAGTSLSVEFLKRHLLLPLGWRDQALELGVLDPFDNSGLAAAAFAGKCAVIPYVLGAGRWKTAFERLYAVRLPAALPETTSTPSEDDAARLRDYVEQAPAVRLVDTILEDALKRGASDIHIEPQPDRVRIRFRIDGQLVLAKEEGMSLAGPIAARIKILSGLDVADRRSPQDGRTSLAVEGRPVDVRVSTVPTAFGESVALRLLRREQALLDLDALGLPPPLQHLLRQVLKAKQGLFLVTGPTGSGKTTTLYAMIEQLRTAPLKIVSVEDPVEYFFPDISQTQVNEIAGLTFARALRAFLRQDPDVILVGEVRDSETARIAIQAALTGHLVLATLHTADAPSAIARLADMGIERFLLSATLMGVLSQRLVRAMCACVSSSGPEPDPECGRCRGSGRAGRRVVAEGFGVNDAMRRAIVSGQAAEMFEALAAQGYVPLTRVADDMVADGLIHPAEAEGLRLI